MPSNIEQDPRDILYVGRQPWRPMIHVDAFLGFYHIDENVDGAFGIVFGLAIPIDHSVQARVQHSQRLTVLAHGELQPFQAFREPRSPFRQPISFRHICTEQLAGKDGEGLKTYS
jgi:hypothetical protein